MTTPHKQHGFGQNHSDLAFYDRFPTLEKRRTARDKFTRKCLNCGEGDHFARDCPNPFMNVSAQINPDVGSSNAAETENSWRRWQGSIAAGVRTRPHLSRSVRSSGFPLRDTHGNPGDLFLVIEIKCRLKGRRRTGMQRGVT